MRLSFPALGTFSALALFFTQCTSFHKQEEQDWHNEVSNEIKVLGARNWLIIAEPSFSSLSGQGAKTIVTDAPSPEVLQYVLDTLDGNAVTNPVIYLPLEMNYVGEDYAPGMKNFRKEVKNILLGQNTQEAQHETLRRLVLDAAKNYNVLVIKTATALPFSNIYMELDSGYWSSESEAALRQKMEPKKSSESPKEETPASQPEQKTSESSSSPSPPPTESVFDRAVAI